VPVAPYQNAFERAVARERAAIAAHQRAAVAEDATAAVIEDRARFETDPERREDLLRRATADRDRAGRARERADRARQRLVDEGVDA
jgi:hypothetical protein